MSAGSYLGFRLKYLVDRLPPGLPDDKRDELLTIADYVTRLETSLDEPAAAAWLERLNEGDWHFIKLEVAP